MTAVNPAYDFDQAPFLICWETTRACDLSCLHCRAQAEPDPAPDELTTNEAMKLIDSIAKLGTRILIFTGGDPLKRADLNLLVRHAKSQGLRTATIPAVTSLLSRQTLEDLKDCGLNQVAFSLDSATADKHDALRQTQGTFDRTLQAVRWAHEAGLPVQINSLLNIHNAQDFRAMSRLVESLNVVFWEIFFLVPTGRGKELSLLSAEEFEQAFDLIFHFAERVAFIVKVTEAPHYRRYHLQQLRIKKGLPPDPAHGEEILMPDDLTRRHGPGGSMGLAPRGVNAGKGFAFIAHNGDVMPSGFLAVSAGNVRSHALSDLYRNHPLFLALRNPSQLKGRCGICPYRELCGGSRARAYALTGDYLEEDPCCIFRPLTARGRPAP